MVGMMFGTYGTAEKAGNGALSWPPDESGTEERIQFAGMAAVPFLFLRKNIFTDEMCYSIMEMLENRNLLSPGGLYYDD